MNREIPTIVIGLGGIGSEIVEKLERQMWQCGTDINHSKYKRENVRFVIVDTDINSIRERRRSGYSGYSVKMSGNISVRSCLERDEDARIEWFPDNKNYYRKSIAEGAGQIRSISRLALQYAIKIGMLEPLYEAIRDMFRKNGNLQEQELKIAIVSTIAGGTGSGALLPLAMHIKDYLNREYSASGAKINAFLILPEILYGVIPSNEERRNLNANSYAAIKEIDALIMERPQNQYIKMPNEKDDQVMKFQECPFDFCFLFSGLSNNKTKYDNIEDYKNVIARCLYTQFLGTLAREYFSKEDNIFSSNTSPGSLNEHRYERFAGAGCAIVRYPYKEIREYLSLCWMSDIMKGEWVKYDEKRKELRKLNHERQENGEEAEQFSEGEGFLQAVKEVDRQEKEKYPAKLSCEEKLYQNNRGNTQVGLLKEIVNYIRDAVAQKRGDVVTHIEDGADIIEKGYIKRKKDMREHLKNYIAYGEELKAENGRIYAALRDAVRTEICRLHEGNLKEYHLEYYLRNQEGEFESPNYIRFILYTIIEEAKIRIKQLERELGLERYSDSDRIALENTRICEMNCTSIKLQIRNLKDIYDNERKDLENKLEKHYLDELIKYLQEISDNYERFFREYTGLLTLVERRKIEMEKRFHETILRMEHWVYADNVYLQEMLKTMRLSPEYFSIGGNISETLYKGNIGGKRAGNMTENYQNTKEMWEKEFDRYFKEKFDMNVLKALVEEAKSGDGKTINIAHIKERLEDARENASILIAACRKPNIFVRKYCIFPAEVIQVSGCGEVIDEFFGKETAFMDDRGLDIDNKQIIFYEIGYGFLPSDIDFFAKDPGMCADYPAGSGVQSYEWTIDNFCDKNRDAEITPHIDRRWHREKFLDVNWNTMAFTPFVAQILWILYYEAAIWAKNGKAFISSRFDVGEEEIKNAFGNYYNKSMEEINRIISEKRQHSATEILCEEIKQNEDVISCYISEIKLIHNVVLDNWSHSRKGTEYLKVRLKEGFFRALRDYGMEEDTIQVYSKKWEEPKESL